MLFGMEHTSISIEASDPIKTSLYDRKPFEKAVSMLKSKIPVTKKEWNSIDQKLKFRSFTVARLAEVDHIETVRQKLIQAFEQGEGFTKSWDDIKKITEQAGVVWKPGYWETVYRTNIQSCYTAGRLMQYDKINPYGYQLLVIEDERTTDICRSLLGESGYGLALPATHPFWQKYGFPPYHFNCRTGIRAVHSTEANNTIKIDNPKMPQLGKTFKPTAGFGGNPIHKESWWRLTDGMIERAEKYGITGELVYQAHELGMTQYAPELVKGFTPEKGLKKGKVYISNNWDYSESEKRIARSYAESTGQTVHLLPRSDTRKSPDALVGNTVAEIKETLSLSGVDKRTKEAIKQNAQIILMEVSDSLIENDIFNTVGARLYRTMQRGVTPVYVEKFVLFHKEKIQEKSIEELIRPFIKK